MSAMERTIRECRKMGRICGPESIVERFVQFKNGGGYRRDLYRFIDLIALDVQKRQIIGIQVCGSDFSPHYRKMTENEEVTPFVVDWLVCRGTIELWGWRKLKRGNKMAKFYPRIKHITWDDLKGHYEPESEREIA